MIILDDDKEFLKFLETMLSRHGIAAEYESDTNQFMEKLNGYNLAIIDYRLEGDLNGLEVMKLIKEKNPDCKVILISAMDNPERTLEWMRAGADDFVFKGISSFPENLIKAIKKITNG